MRTAFFGQKVKKSSVEYPFPTTWHQLTHHGGRLMSDWPIEQRQIDENLKGMRGSVLVGGLGLGYAATVLLQRRSVSRVTVVEIAPEVIELVKPFTKDPNKKLTVVHADVLDWFKSYKGEQFDHAFFDIWSSDGEGTFFETVCPLYDLSKGKVEHSPVNWNEDIMRGQLYHGLTSRMLFSKPGAFEHLKVKPPMMQPWEKIDGPWDTIFHNWAVPFFQWWKETQPNDELAGKAASYYASNYGKWNWTEYWDAWKDLFGQKESK